MISDFRFALRSLVRAPGFAAVSIVILMLGIGAVTAVFSAVEAVLLRPFPFAHPERLFVVDSAAPDQFGLFSLPEFRAYRDQNRSFQGMAALASATTNLVAEGNAQLVQGFKASASIFDLLGVKPALGRLLEPRDDLPGAPKVVVIGAGLWQRAFGGRRDIVGRTVSLDGEAREVVGVLPASCVLPLIGYHNDVCLPLQSESDPTRYRHGTLHYLRVIGRLRPGVSPAQAQSDLDAVLAGLRRRYPEAYAGPGKTVITAMESQIVSDSRPVLLTLFGAVVAVLLLASSNLAGLHLVRAIGQQREFAVRTALGASRFRLVRLVLAECLILAAAGGAAGLMLAGWGVRSLVALIPPSLPRGHDLRFNGTIFGFAALVSLVFGLIPALAPVWLISRANLREAMAAGGRGATAGQGRVRHWLASVQVALALALLACLALFLRSFWAIGKQRLGFDSDSAQVVTARLSLPAAGYPDAAALIRQAERLRDRLTDFPGVERAGATSLLPLVPGLATVQFLIPGRPVVREAEIPSANYRLVTPDYFDAMGIRLRAGRGFTARDDAARPLVAIVGAKLADAYFPRRDAVGQRIQIQDTLTGYRTALIVGVANDVKQDKLEAAATFDVWVPYRQMDPVAVPWLRYRTYWVVRGTAPAPVLEEDLRRAVRAEDPSIAVSSVRTLEQVTAAAGETRRFTLVIVGFFAATAVVLTIAGIYSVIAFGVARRTREIGLRLALGARADQVRLLILREGAGIVLLGAPVGVVGSLFVSRLIAAQLYGVAPGDPAAVAAAIVLVAVIAGLASWLPARRASRIDPLTALRAE